MVVAAGDGLGKPRQGRRAALLELGDRGNARLEALGEGPILDGLMRNTPDAHAFIDKAIADGVRAATEERDQAAVVEPVRYDWQQ